MKVKFKNLVGGYTGKVDGLSAQRNGHLFSTSHPQIQAQSAES
jgi:hypothetical protein